ncbi:MAG TPA: hypothetical protein VGI80_04120 [Pyrinomonadaceae bacterium]|jgi:hypothetical protein
MADGLTRYWFPIARGTGWGVGVTAYSLQGARSLIAAEGLLERFELGEPIEDVDIRTLDQGHVIPNMSPPNLRGVWFPICKVLVELEPPYNRQHDQHHG